MTRTAHSDLEHQILIATLCMKGNVYSVSVAQVIEARTVYEVARSAWSIALQRFGEKGLLQSTVEDQLEQSGRVRRYFDLNAAGR